MSSIDNQTAVNLQSTVPMPAAASIPMPTQRLNKLVNFATGNLTYQTSIAASAARAPVGRRPPTHLQTDSTRPDARNQVNELQYVHKLVTAICDCSIAKDNDPQLDKIEAIFYKDGQVKQGGISKVELAAWAFYDCVVAYHRREGPFSLTLKQGPSHDQIRRGNGSFAKHIEDLAGALRTWKSVCFKVLNEPHLAPERAAPLVDDVTRAVASALASWKSNQNKLYHKSVADNMASADPVLKETATKDVAALSGKNPPKTLKRKHSVPGAPETTVSSDQSPATKKLKTSVSGPITVGQSDEFLSEDELVIPDADDSGRFVSDFSTPYAPLSRPMLGDENWVPNLEINGSNGSFSSFDDSFDDYSYRPLSLSPSPYASLSDFPDDDEAPLPYSILEAGIAKLRKNSRLGHISFQDESHVFKAHKSQIDGDESGDDAKALASIAPDLALSDPLSGTRKRSSIDEFQPDFDDTFF